MVARVTLTEVARLDVAAASGLVGAAGRLYVVADDELDLCVYDDSGRPLERVALFAGALDGEQAARKAAKPDLEALAWLAPELLVAVPSGSTAARHRGAAVHGLGPGPGPGLGIEATATREVIAVDLAPLYAWLAHELADLNIEGAAATGDALVLLQRGNGAAGLNAAITLDRNGACDAILAGRPLGPSLVRRIQPVALGQLDGVALGFTDASPLPDGRLVYSAAAEAGGSTYEDGAALGSVLGILDGDTPRAQVRLDTRDKIEGVHAVVDGDRLRLKLVTDADDRARRATLYAATLPLATFD